MDWAAFGLARDPFQRGAELDDACLPNTISALVSELLSSLRSPQGVSVLVGDGGSGKSMAAAAFARRAGGSAHVATLAHPTSSVAAIARDALAQFDPTDFDFSLEEDWVAALRARVERSTRAGRTTVILLDDAHRLSPQTLQDLAEYFTEDETLRLHVLLVGRPKLLDRLQAGAEEALRAHLLQICRLEPLGVRESVRYLERRMAICGGELAGILSDEAIDEIVQKAGGCVIRLEELAVEALRRASGKGASRATVVDVVAMARTAVAEEEDEIMAVRQQPLRFAIEQEALDEEDVSWGDDGDDKEVEWGDEHGSDEEDDEDWRTAGDDEEEEEHALRWDASPPRLDAGEEDLEDLEDDDDDDDEPEPAAGRPASLRRRLAGPAVLSLGACLALVWAANQMPGPDSGERRGRDAVLFAERLSSEPSQIMRLATTVEAADADAHVHRWHLEPPRPVVVRQPAAEVAAVASNDASPRRAEENGNAGADDSFMGPLPERPVEVAVSPGLPAKGGTAAAPKKETVVASTKAGPAVSKPAAASAKKQVSPVYTVQIGAFKARRNAEEMVTRLRGKSPRILQEGGLYRVISGSFASKRDAVVHEATLRRAGYSTYVRTAVY